MILLDDEALLKECAYIDGQWVSGDLYEVCNPAENTPIARVPDLGRKETEQAVNAANSALASWKTKTAKERSSFLMSWHRLILENLEDLANILTFEQGKPLAESRAEIRYGASFIEWFAEEGKRVYGDIVPPHGHDKRILVLKQPIGVVAAITPWNFPNAMITRKVAPALAAGCPVVVKPSEETPLSALALAELAHRAGFPKGVFNVVTTNNPQVVGQELTENPKVKKLSFTGSTEVGKLLMAQCASTVKKVSLELGGNAPFIVFEDADLDEAVKGAMICKYRNAGQTCVCANRILVQDSIYEAFSKKLSKAVASLKVGPGNEDGTTIGPLINEAALEKVNHLVNDALEKGATVLQGGDIHPLGETYSSPTILTNVNSTMACARNEIFGPVAPLIRFKTEESAIEIANDTPYGLAAYFYSRDIGRVWRVSEALEYGIVGINEGIISTEVAPFGGIKESGMGREGSKYGMDDFLEIKYLCLGGL